MFSFSESMPTAQAKIKGYTNFAKIEGTVSFFEVHGGTVVLAEIRNLPTGNRFHGFHIHNGNCETPGQHYAKESMQHPNHTGDMPSLLANDGMAFLVFYTNRFYPEDVIGKTVVIHEKEDDFTSQPSGNAGVMIACGLIEEIKQ